MTPPEKPADLTPTSPAAGVEDAEGAPLTLEDALVAVEILRRTVETLQVENARLRGLVSPGYARHSIIIPFAITFAEWCDRDTNS